MLDPVTYNAMLSNMYYFDCIVYCYSLYIKNVQVNNLKQVYLTTLPLYVNWKVDLH